MLYGVFFKALPNFSDNVVGRYWDNPVLRIINITIQKTYKPIPGILLIKDNSNSMKFLTGYMMKIYMLRRFCVFPRDLKYLLIISSVLGVLLASSTTASAQVVPTVEFDQKRYTWTDKAYITVVSPESNFDGNLIDQIFITASTSDHALEEYRLVETGVDTAKFAGEIILTGFQNHDANDDGHPDDATGIGPHGDGPTDGFLPALDKDVLRVTFRLGPDDPPVVASAEIGWNIGKISWLEAIYPASGTGTVRIIDPDMNLNPEAIDSFDISVWSDSDSGGIKLTVTETGEAGIFDGTVSFTNSAESSGHKLRVAEGDTVTARYTDRTLPPPYATASDLDILGTAFIGISAPPLETAPITNLIITDLQHNVITTGETDKQILVTAQITNTQERGQPFSYLLKIHDEDGVTADLGWITGTLNPHQSMSPSKSWIPTKPGKYTLSLFNWQGVDNPNALSSPVTTDFIVTKKISIIDTGHKTESKIKPIIDTGHKTESKIKPIDTDNDGVIDTQDKCITIPEDQDGVEDSDGCPEQNLPDWVIPTVGISVAGGLGAAVYFIKAASGGSGGNGPKPKSDPRPEPPTPPPMWIEVVGGLSDD